MPSKFVGNIQDATPRAEADVYVPPSTVGDDVRAFAKGLEDATTHLALQSIKQEYDAESDASTDLYRQSREIKNNMFDAAAADDEAAVSKYAKQLEELKIAEKQGLISGSNSQIRQETLLKRAINRFPHLENEIRTISNRQRARNESLKEQFEDPVEKGRDALLQESAAAGESLIQTIERKEAERGAEQLKRDMDWRAALGVDLQPSLDAAFTNSFEVLTSSRITALQGRVVEAVEGGDLLWNPALAKANFEAARRDDKVAARNWILSAVRNSPSPDAIISPDLIDKYVARIDEMYDKAAPMLDDIDTLKKMVRTRELNKELGYLKLQKYDPIMAFAINVAPEAAVAAWIKDIDFQKRMIEKGAFSRIDVLEQNAPTPFEKARLRTQRAMIQEWNGQELADDFKGAVESGAPPASSGDPMVDATKMHVITQSTLGSKDMPPESKRNVAGAALAAEQQYSPPGTYVAPSATWYKNPNKRKMLKDPAFQQTMTENITNAIPHMLKQIDPSQLQTLMFMPQLETEQKIGPDKWRAYPDGGPWSAGAAKGEFNTTLANAGFKGSAANSGPLASGLKHLNDIYWLYREMYGPVKAEELSMQILSLGEQPGEGEDGAPGEDGLPSFDLTD